MSADRLNRLLDDAARAPWHHDFFQLLRTIDALHPALPRLGLARRPTDEPIRLGQAPEMRFAPTTLHGVQHRDPGVPPCLEVAFFGLFGPNGPLPLHLTEYARQRLINEGDANLVDFANLFHHRLLLLFYRAWAQAQPTVGMDRPQDDRFADYVGALAGLGTPALRGRDAVPDHAKLHFAGLLTRQSRSAEGLEAMLSGWLRRSVRVTQFSGHWMPLQAAERTRIGGRRSRRRHEQGARLGRGAVLGRMVWDRQHHFSVAVGPLDHPAFLTLLPSGDALPGVVALVELYVGHEFAWDLRLALRVDQVRPVQPGRHGRLGWDSWLGRPRPAPGRPADTVELRLMPAEALQAWARRRGERAAPAGNPGPHTPAAGPSGNGPSAPTPN